MKTIKLLASVLFSIMLFGTAYGQNTYYGLDAGQNGVYNTNYGNHAGFNLTSSAIVNTFIGHEAGYSNASGWANVFVGAQSGLLSTGTGNTFVGNASGINLTTGNYNVFIGYNAGGNAGSISNKLYIDNSNTNTPLIYGDFASNKVGINTTNFPTSVGGVDISAYSLFVNGGILTKEVRVRTTWADYVFDKGYQLPSLYTLEKYIKTNGHLPNVPSEEKVLAEGLEIGEITKIQQEKIEELTLYIIQLNHKLDELEKKINTLEINNTESHESE